MITLQLTAQQARELEAVVDHAHTACLRNWIDAGGNSDPIGKAYWRQKVDAVKELERKISLACYGEG